MNAPHVVGTSCRVKAYSHGVRIFSFILLGLLCGRAWAQQAPPSADEIMARVAVNQDRAQAERSHYVYVQHVRVLSRKGQKVMCEEVTDARITPSSSGFHAQWLKLDGRVLEKNKYVQYATLPAAGSGMVEADQGSVDINIGNDDRDMVESMRAGLTNETSRDGINTRLFPLTSKSQGDYLFQLLGRERLNGRDVFHIDFRPKDKNDFDWKGEAYIDTAAYEPVAVTTSLSRNVPLAVRALLGTDLPGLGFTVVYAPQAEGVWFPVSFGTEFKVHVLFFFRREIVLDAHNRDFEKTHVSAEIVGPPAPAQ